MTRNHSSILTLTYCLFSFLNCVQYTKYIPDPKKDIDQWVKNFEGQRSFSFKYEMKTKTTQVKSAGDCLIGWAEHSRGLWDYGGIKEEFEYIGLGDIEYEKRDKKWEMSSRGEEANIFAQIKRMLNFDKFEYLDLKEGFNYRFKPNVPFLAPEQWEQMTGSLRISQKNFLPELIWAGLPDSSVYWQVKLSQFNRLKNINSPVNKWNDYLLTTDSLFCLDKLRKIIKRRLSLIGVNYRLRKEDSLIMLTMPEQYKTEDIAELLTRGKVVVYGLTENQKEATKIGYLRDNPKQPLFFTTKIMEQHNIKDAKIKFDACLRPYILLLLSKRFSLPQTLCFEVDEVIVGIASLDKPQKMDKIVIYLDMGYYQTNILKASLIQPLPAINIKPIFKGHN